MTTSPLLSRRRPLATLVATVMLATAIALLTGGTAHAGTAPTTQEQQAIDHLNNYRAGEGLQPLAVAGTLQSSAHDWAVHSAATLRSTHESDANVQAACRAGATGVTRCGEIVGRASGSAASVIEAFKISEAHRNAMKCDTCNYIGVGAARGSDNQWYVVVRLMAATSADGTGTTTSTTTTTTTQPGATTTTTAPSSNLTAAQKFVKSVYQDFLGRQPNSSELAHWSGRVATQAQREQFVRTHAYSDAYIGVQVDRYYTVALGRPADPAGKAYWSDIIRRRTLTPAQVASHFYASQEYFTRSGSSLHNWISDLYVQLLKRQADTAGRNYWVGVAQRSGRVPVATNFYDSRESLNVRVDTLYRDLLGRPSDAGGRTFWGDTVRQSGNDVDLAVFLATSSEYMTRAQSRY